MHRSPGFLAAVASLLLIAGCGSGGSAGSPATAATAFRAIDPAGGAANVPTNTAVTLTFSGPMMDGMDAYLSLHEQSVTGPIVPCSATWSPDRTRVTLMPDMPLRSNTSYVVHLGGGMMDADGVPIDYGDCPMFGGQPVTGHMMGGGMMGVPGGEMGPGWRGGNDRYGMAFVFTTG